MKTLDQIVTHLLATESLAAKSRWLILGALAVRRATSAAALTARDPGRRFARHNRRGGTARATEVSVAAVSTLRWGYGDLMMNRTLGCGAWTC